jgi:ribose transport system permease protein
MTNQTVAKADEVSRSRSQLLTDVKYRWPARHRSAWVALALLVVVVGITVPASFSGPSLTLVTALAGVLAIAAVGQTLIIMLGALDLSISAIISVSAGMVVHYGGEGSNTLFVLGAALLVPIVISLVNGVLIAVLRLNALIVTLATFGIISGLVQLWTGQSLSLTGQAPQGLQDFSQKAYLGISVVFLSSVVVCLLLGAVLSKTRFGRQIATVGANRRAARALGQRVTRVELTAFALAGLLYGLSGILLAGYIGTPDVLSGTPYQLATITVAGIAGALFSGGPASVASVLAACLLLQLLDQSLSIVGLPAGARVVIQGLVLVIAVAALQLGQAGASGFRWARRLGGPR